MLWQRRREQLQKLQQQKAQINERAVQQAEGLIADTTRQLRQLRREAGADPGARGQVALAAQIDEVRQQLDPFRPQTRARRSSDQAIEVGELVQVLPLGVTAEVVRIQGPDAELQISGKRMRQALSQLEAFAPRRFAARGEKKSLSVSQPSAPPAQQMRLVLVGQRVDAALQKLERFLDNALLAGLSQVEIVHGSGSGALRRAVREYLAAQRCITAFYAAAAEHGGEKITVAELGD